MTFRGQRSKRLERGCIGVPAWIELSGLPLALNDAAKLPYCWAVFRKLVEFDMEANRVRPAEFEVTVAELALRCGIDGAKAHKAIKAIRKEGLIRCFLPDTDEEPALFQLILPLKTPQTADETRAKCRDAFIDAEWPPRYAAEPPPPTIGESTSRAARTQRVVDLYLNTFSMKLNSLILDELQLITDRYDDRLIEKVFRRAKAAEATSLGWIVAEIRREKKAEEKVPL